jgi:tRNA threonylcarbamoyladenosine biosynthesis protein TsaE
MRVTTAGADETRAFAARVADLAVAGDLLVLVGDLGAGKTAFVQGLAAALGSSDPVTSPTFTIAHRYTGGRLVVHHLDAYRLAGPEEATDLALDELLDDNALTVVEWGDRLQGLLPVERLELVIRFGEGDDDRIIHLEPGGPGWAVRVKQLEASC